jgi:acyl-CoA thioester hydrolase
MANSAQKPWREMPIDLSALLVVHTATIPEDYLDAMGHMNVMWYTHMFDRSMYNLFDQLGCSAPNAEEQSGAFALEVHLRYLSEVRVGDQITIRTRLLGRSEKRFHVLNFMTNDTNGDLAATFELVGAHIDMKVRRMAPLPELTAAKLDELIVRHKELDWQPPICGTMNP